MGLVYLPTYIYIVDFYGFHVGKYTVRPMDPTTTKETKEDEEEGRGRRRGGGGSGVS